jgi:hypothetical protein
MGSNYPKRCIAERLTKFPVASVLIATSNRSARESSYEATVIKTNLGPGNFSIRPVSGDIPNGAAVTPFVIGQPGNLGQFPEAKLSNATRFRTPPVS